MFQPLSAIAVICFLNIAASGLCNAGFIRMSGEVFSNAETEGSDVPPGFSVGQKIYMSLELPANLSYTSLAGLDVGGGVFNLASIAPGPSLFNSFDIGTYEAGHGNSVKLSSFSSYYKSQADRQLHYSGSTLTTIAASVVNNDSSPAPKLQLEFNATAEFNGAEFVSFDPSDPRMKNWERDWDPAQDLRLTVYNDSQGYDYFIVGMRMSLDQSTELVQGDLRFSTYDLVDGENDSKLTFNEGRSEFFSNGVSMQLFLRPVDGEGKDYDLIQSVSFETKLLEIHATVPEPTSLFLVGTASIAGLYFRRIRKAIRFLSPTPEPNDHQK